jgi:hypothetical protein
MELMELIQKLMELMELIEKLIRRMMELTSQINAMYL